MVNRNGEHKVEGENSRVDLGKSDFIKWAGVKSEKYAAFPALVEKSAREGMNQQGGDFALQAIRRVKVELLGCAVFVFRGLLDSSIEAERLIGRAKVSGQGADME